MTPHSALENRYPQLAFLLTCASCDHEDKERPFSVDLNDVELLYVYGVGKGEVFHEVKKWLEADPRRDLIFIEDNPHALSTLADEELIAHPKVHIRYLMPNASLTQFARELAFEFPIHRFTIAATKEGKRFHRLKLLLKRATTLSHALFNEDFYYHELFKNLCPNLLRIEGSFYVNRLKGSCKGIPAIICGAGPSLDGVIDKLKEMEERALIFAGGSTITALTCRGVQPHIGMAIDPNPEEYDRLEPNRAQNMPLIFAPRVNRAIFGCFQGPFGYLRSFTGGPIEQWIEEELGLTEGPMEEKINPEALSVTTSCIALAQFLGCGPIYFAGIDLAYTELKRYAFGVMEDSRVSLNTLKSDTRASESYLRRKGQKGKMVHTLVKWVMEASWISSFAKKHPETRFVNLTDEGLGFKGIPYGNFGDLPVQKSLRQRLLSQFEAVKLVNQPVRESLEKLYESFKRCYALIEEMENNPLCAFLSQMELEEELAYKLALSAFCGKLKFVVRRRDRESDPEKNPLYFKTLKSTLEAYLAVFDKNLLRDDDRLNE